MLKIGKLKFPKEGFILLGAGVVLSILVAKFTTGDVRETLLPITTGLSGLGMWFMKNPTMNGKPMSIPPPPNTDDGDAK